jgi:hypothetical protein
LVDDSNCLGIRSAAPTALPPFLRRAATRSPEILMVSTRSLDDFPLILISCGAWSREPAHPPQIPGQNSAGSPETHLTRRGVSLALGDETRMPRRDHDDASRPLEADLVRQHVPARRTSAAAAVARALRPCRHHRRRGRTRTLGRAPAKKAVLPARADPHPGQDRELDRARHRGARLRSAGGGELAERVDLPSSSSSPSIAAP